jgi:hypothetical protein
MKKRWGDVEDEEAAAVAEAAGQRIFTSGPVGVRFNGLYAVYDNGEMVTITIIYSDDYNLQDGVPVTVDPEPIYLPRSLFASDEQLLEWCRKVHHDFQRLWHKVMVVETEQHFRDAANYHLGKMGVAPVDLKAVVRAHQDYIEDEIKNRFQSRDVDVKSKRGRHSKWGEARLMAELQAIVNDLNIPPEQLTWEPIFLKLKGKFPQEAPKNAEVLRKRAASFGKNLSDLQRVGK